MILSWAITIPSSAIRILSSAVKITSQVVTFTRVTISSIRVTATAGRRIDLFAYGYDCGIDSPAQPEFQL
jgi:hypothetical protein